MIVASSVLLTLLAAVAAAAAGPDCDVARKPCPAHPGRTYCPTNHADKHQCDEQPCSVPRKPCPTRPSCFFCPANLTDKHQCSEECGAVSPGTGGHSGGHKDSPKVEIPDFDNLECKL